MISYKQIKLGEQIKELRNKNQLTQQQLAEKIDAKTITIRKYESNERTPTITVLKKLAVALNCDINDFFQYSIKNESNFINAIFEFFGYTITFKRLENSSVEYTLTTLDDKEFILSELEMEEFIFDLKEIIKFQISHAFKKHDAYALMKKHSDLL